jgi:hypothetical protein
LLLKISPQFVLRAPKHCPVGVALLLVRPSAPRALFLVECVQLPSTVRLIAPAPHFVIRCGPHVVLVALSHSRGLLSVALLLSDQVVAPPSDLRIPRVPVLRLFANTLRLLPFMPLVILTHALVNRGHMRLLLRIRLVPRKLLLCKLRLPLSCCVL